MSEHGPQDKNSYWVPSHIRVCATATGTVVLDLKRNRYFGLGPRETRALATLAANWRDVTSVRHSLEPMPLDEASRLADALVKAGFLVTSAPPPEAIELHPMNFAAELTCVSHDVERSAALRPHHFLTFVRACFWARRAVKSRILYSVVCEVSRRKRSAPATIDEHKAFELVRLFGRLRPYAFTANDQCLFHALALLRFLSHYDIFPTWVIAVRPVPWAAHTWLQLGSVLLDANPDEISGYTPILAI